MRFGVNSTNQNYVNMTSINLTLVCCCLLSCNVEYNASYACHALFAYFDRDNVALKGFAK